MTMCFVALVRWSMALKISEHIHEILVCNLGCSMRGLWIPFREVLTLTLEHFTLFVLNSWNVSMFYSKQRETPAFTMFSRCREMQHIMLWNQIFIPGLPILFACSSEMEHWSCKDDSDSLVVFPGKCQWDMGRMDCLFMTLRELKCRPLQ